MKSTLETTQENPRLAVETIPAPAQAPTTPHRRFRRKKVAKQLKRLKRKAPVEITNGRHTVKIYTTNSRGQQLFQLSFYRAGRRERQTFVDLRQAKQEAQAILCQLASLVAESEKVVSMPEVEALVAARAALTNAGLNLPLHLAVEGLVNAVTQLGSPEAPLATLQQAVAFYVKHHPVGFKRLPLDELIAQYVKARQRVGISERYKREIGYICNKLKKWFPGLIGLPAGAEIVAKLDETFTSAVTKNCHLRIYKTLALWATKERLVGLESIRSIDLWKEPVSDVEIYTPAELRQILETVAIKAPGAVSFVAIGAFAGLRTAEIYRLDWKEVLLDRGKILVAPEKAKTAVRRLVPISDNLRAWLEPYVKESGPVMEENRQWVEYQLRTNNLPRKRNALRHSYISYRVAQVHDVPRVALECGNSPEIIFKHYRELVMEDAAKEWFNVAPPPRA